MSQKIKGDIVELNDGFTRNQSIVPNAIINARTKMTALELKTFYQVLTLINMDDTEFKEYEIGISDFSRTLGITDTNRGYLVKLCKRIIRQVFEIEQVNGDYLAYTIFSRLHYKHKEQKIAMRFNDELRPFLLQIKSHFTKIQQVKYIKSFDSKYAIRFYAFLKSYRLMSQRDFNLEALHKVLELPNSYANYKNFYDKVLSPALKEINEKSDLWVSEPEIIGKIGRKITDIRLYFGNKSEKQSADFINGLTKLYKRLKTWQIFIGIPFPRISTNIENIGDLVYITSIKYDNINKYHQAIHRDNCGKEWCLLGSNNQAEFLKELTFGIYRAMSFLYENEKKQQLPTLQWQDKQDRIKRMKEFLNYYAQKNNNYEMPKW